jgi:hypothetical protein
VASITGWTKSKHNVPRKAHAKQDPNQKEAFKRSIVDQLDALEIPKGCPIRIWVEDEHRYGLISTVRRCWTLSGHRVVAPYHTKYQWGYVYGACELIEAQAFFLVAPNCLACDFSDILGTPGSNRP